MGDAGLVLTRDAAVAERVRCLRNMGKADKYAYSSGLSGLSDIGLPHVERGTPPAWLLFVVRCAATLSACGPSQPPRTLLVAARFNEGVSRAET